MSGTAERVCVVCQADDEHVRFEMCGICRRHFCPDCAHRAGHGRRFCSPECGRAYYFTGEPDDDENTAADE